MPKRKNTSDNGVSFHSDFREPTKTERFEALGDFPCPQKMARPRMKMINAAASRLNSNSDTGFLPADLDNPKLYKATKGSRTTFAIPIPRSEEDWLANVPEEPQTFDDYAKFLMSRSGTMRPICNAVRDDIILLPIVRGQWPDQGALLESLVALTKAYFNRPVRLLPPALIVPGNRGGVFRISFPTTDPARDTFEITGRADKTSGRIQYNVDALLSSLVNFRDDATPSPHAADGGPPLNTSSFCIMGLTMEDLYQTSSDLFVAGMAAGGSKVAVFSFARYHPHIKIHPENWHDYGYGAEADAHPYFDGSADEWPEQRIALASDPLTFESLTGTSKAEYIRRCGKLLVHELGHLYGLNHCIFNRCLMMGTGHLVEDFATPFHLCPVCLRKMQWRLGFSVVGRYKLLTEAFRAMGLGSEEKWTQKQIDSLSGALSENS